MKRKLFLIIFFGVTLFLLIYGLWIGDFLEVMRYGNFLCFSCIGIK
ncbi:MAG: hypothetical protein AB1393_08830 [Candidatus Edwardsbacteria bacterium]